MDSTDLSYRVDGLSASGEQHSAVSTTCTRVRETLDGHGIALPMLGTVTAAGPFHAIVAHVVSAQSTDAMAEATRRSELAARAGRVAEWGAGLVEDTTQVARAVPVSAPQV